MSDLLFAILLLQLLQSTALAYLVIRALQPQKAPELRDLVRQALTKKLEDGTALTTGRERLQARLAARRAERQAKAS